MNRHDLDKKRLEPCIAEVYAKASGPTPDCYPQSFETWRKHGVWAFYRDEKEKPVTVIPMDCYHISETDLKKIVEKWSKGLHGFWYYIPKLTFGEPDYKKHVKELEDFREFEAEVSKDKTLTYAQRAAKIKKEALAHNFMWRSSDKEYISFNVYLGVSPNTSLEWVEKNHAVYRAIEEAAKAGKIINLYIDYVHMDSFMYKNGDKTLHAIMEEKQYWHDTNGKVTCQNTPGRTYCNLYDDNGEYVDYLWNHEDVRRSLSAQTMDIMIERFKPVVIETLKSQGREDLVEWLEHKSYMDKDLKQCFAVWIMSQWYLADK